MQTAIADGVAAPKNPGAPALGTPRLTQRHQHGRLRPYAPVPHRAAGAGE
ncbi:hypothetical protein ACWD7F_16990 [Streptomyces sp. NPDC005122]